MNKVFSKNRLLSSYPGWCRVVQAVRCLCVKSFVPQKVVSVQNQDYLVDKWTNITPQIISKIGTNLHTNKKHPLGLIKTQIQNYFYKEFVHRGNPMFSVYDNLNPVVSLAQNFDHLLVAPDHPSRAVSDSYYLNTEHMLRAHMTAHQLDLIQTGLDAFLMAGDVYRRDEVDATHYPVFHQLDGVRIFTNHELFRKVREPSSVSLFEDGQETALKQSVHTMETVKLVEFDLKSALEKMAFHLFGDDIEIRWVDAYFPFTHPSWEMEIRYKDDWLEVLGCGVMRHAILKAAGVGDKVGWAFGLGLERLAMKLYSIPDIRLFWSTDSGFLSQFDVTDPYTPITYQPVSVFPQCTNDISFWIPDGYQANDFFDLVRSVGGEIIEQVRLVDTFLHPKHQKTSHCYRIVYRHMEKTMTQSEVNVIHSDIEKTAVISLGVELR